MSLSLSVSLSVSSSSFSLLLYLCLFFYSRSLTLSLSLCVSLSLSRSLSLSVSPCLSVYASVCYSENGLRPWASVHRQIGKSCWYGRGDRTDLMWGDVDCPEMNVNSSLVYVISTRGCIVGQVRDGSLVRGCVHVYLDPH